MINFRPVLLALAFVTGASVVGGGVKPSPPRSDDADQHWTADNGNGTYSNPLFYEEFEDPDPIRVGNDYFLAGSTMHMNPAVILMHSKDLVNWELAGYCAPALDLGPQFRLEGGNIYGRGIWAPCIRYHDGMFYVFSNVAGAGLEVFRSRTISGPWERNELPGRHDSSVLFDDELGKIFLISGGASPYAIDELAPDLKSFVPGAHHVLTVPSDGPRMGEGHHLYKIKGKYYDISAMPGGAVNQMVAKSDSIDGPWTVTKMVDGESLGVSAATPAKALPGDRGLWLHQGGMVDTPSGEWWSVIMSDHGSGGRMVSLVPITWDDGFPLIGLPGNLRRAPNTWIKPNAGVVQRPTPAFIHDDDFHGGVMNPLWQWNHVPDNTKWSLTQRKGALRLHSSPAPDFYQAQNTLCQRPPGPESTMTVKLDTSGLTLGDVAGLGLLTTPYAWIGVAKAADATVLEYFQGSAGGTSATALEPIKIPNPPNRLWLRIKCNFDTDLADFSWSGDGKNFTQMGDSFAMRFQLRTFQGVRPALFNFNTSGRLGGYADFMDYTTEEPRARGIERDIPLGKTITLTSGADNSYLAIDPVKKILVNVPHKAVDLTNAIFKVVDLGFGRVALRAANGSYITAAGANVGLINLGNERPAIPESFLWVNLMRGDTMLMSLTNHRYLATEANSTGPVSISSLGPTPARKGGECFKWALAE